jgi:hypothetical protein
MGDASLFLNAEGYIHPTQILYLIEPSYLKQPLTCRLQPVASPNANFCLVSHPQYHWHRKTANLLA